MLELKYEDSDVYDRASEALDRDEAFCLVIKGLRARVIMKARPLCQLLFDNPEQPIRSKRLATLKLFAMYFYLAPTFWGIRFLATRAGMKVTGQRWTEF